MLGGRKRRTQGGVATAHDHHICRAWKHSLSTPDPHRAPRLHERGRRHPGAECMGVMQPLSLWMPGAILATVWLDRKEERSCMPASRPSRWIPHDFHELSAKIVQMGPRAKALPGMIDAYTAWRGDGQGIIVALYHSKEDADRAVGAHPGHLGRPCRPGKRSAADRRLRERSAPHRLSAAAGRPSGRIPSRPLFASLQLSPLKQQLLDLVGGQRPAEQEALHLRAALGPDRIELLLGLDPFRRRLPCRGPWPMRPPPARY